MSDEFDAKRIKSKSKDMKNLIDHGQKIMDMKSWTGNHGPENWSKEMCETDLNILPEVLDEFKQVEATG